MFSSNTELKDSKKFIFCQSDIDKQIVFDSWAGSC